MADCTDPDCFNTVQCGPALVSSFATATFQLVESESVGPTEEPTPSAAAAMPPCAWMLALLASSGLLLGGSAY
jgi:hypothetical protein